MVKSQSLLREAELAGIYTKPEPRPILKLDTYPEIKKLNYQNFNKALGFPYSRITDKRAKMTTYQLAYHLAIKKHHRILLNKTKKGAFTEAFIRHTAREVFDSYAGHEVVFMAGNRASIALDVVERFNTLFEDGFNDQNGKHWRYGDVIEKFNKTEMTIKFYNSTKVIGSPATTSGKSSPVRGYSDVVAWFLTEAAHTGASDDYPVLNGLTSLTANRDYGDRIMETTPNGKNGFFWDLWNDGTQGLKKENLFTMATNGYYLLQYDYRIAVKEGVISQKFIDEEKKDLRVDFAQEYEAKFTSAKSSALPPLEEKSFTKKKSLNLAGFLSGEERIENAIKSVEGEK